MHIRVISPSWPALFLVPRRVERARQWLTARGHRVTFGRHAFEISDDGRSAGSVEQRAADFHEAYANPTVDIVLSAAGGATTADIIDALDPALVRGNPKPFIGHSDNVFVLEFLRRECGQVSFYGCTFMAHFGEAGDVFAGTARAFDDAVSSAAFRRTATPAPQRSNEFFNWQVPRLEGTERKLNVGGGAHIFRPAQVSGILVGAELSVLTTLLDNGLTLNDRILFWDIAPPTDIDLVRALNRLQQHHNMASVRAMVVGPSVHHELDDWTEIVRAALDKVAPEASYPVVIGGDCGHMDPMWVLPYGAEVDLDASLPQLSWLTVGPRFHRQLR